jgi:hypothetical protein
VLASFRKQVRAAGGGNYQKLINLALREYIERRREPLEATLRRVLREELVQRSSPTAGSTSSLREAADEGGEYGRAWKRQRRAKKAKRRGLTGRPTRTRDELHERHPVKKAK